MLRKHVRIWGSRPGPTLAAEGRCCGLASETSATAWVTLAHASGSDFGSPALGGSDRPRGARAATLDRRQEARGATFDDRHGDQRLQL